MTGPEFLIVVLLGIAILVLAYVLDSVIRRIDRLEAKLHNHITVKSPWNLKVEERLDDLEGP